MSGEIEGKRPYRKQARAESEAQTRLRITEAAVKLHGTLGPARTSMSAVAEDAGVRRSTLYRHFPDEDALFEACSVHWGAANPPPDISAWAAVRDPDERLRRGLSELYGWYAQVEGMLGNLIRDMEVSAPVAKRFGAFPSLLAVGADVLLQGRPVRGRARGRVRAALGHAVTFETWRSLVRGQGLGQDDAVALMAGLVDAAAAPRRR